MKGLTKLGLANKITLTTVSLIACSLIFVMGVIYWQLVYFGHDLLNRELAEKANTIELALSEPMWNYDNSQIAKVARSLLNNDKYISITGLKVVDNKGVVLFEKYQDPTIVHFSEIQKRSYTKTKDIKIIRYGKFLGTVSTAVSNEGFVTTRRGHLLEILLKSLSLLFIVSLVLNLYFNKLLAEPLNEIMKSIRNFEKDKASVIDSENLPEEFDVIAKGLSNAWSLVEQRNEAILGYANDLENIVSERTSELEMQITKNMNSARLVAIGEMAADVAHEINNPMTVIDLHVNRIKKNCQNPVNEQTGQDILKSAEKIQSMISRTTKIIKALKVQAREGTNDPMVPFSVSEMLDEVRTLVEMKIKGEEIFFAITMNEPDVEVIGREVQISQVLANLINNSVDAISSLEEKWIKLHIYVTGETVMFTTTDSGHGIPKELQEKMMRPFFTTKGANKGTGLGLSISKSIIEEHEGFFQYNENCKNTQFIFTLKKHTAAQKVALKAG